ncbi:polysaccharide deacetylase family protein [Caldichromatium japonicum]|uniref:Polysaccharide deacetylase family protein n=1 Tax=Caldichromatium japonicum TaxID=2699430 RepID=A0A6G7VG53_9GAMM|nr:polysaccharide deacetylase family protein [Caldichromatium japonicum]QIK39001.1 polysaccharide deacetylase family protein [Caldichromatium japonicum]
MQHPRVSILMYHQVGEFRPMRKHRANYCDHRRFSAQMELVARFYQVIDLETALAGLYGQQPLPRRALVLTFDDAYENFAEHAWPVLERHRLPAIVYAISGYLGRRAEWFAKDPGRPIPRLLSGARLRELHAAGMMIGSHTVDHLRLAELSPKQQRKQLADSRAALEDLLGAPVVHLCYPFGSFNAVTLELAPECGYQSAVTCLRGAATPQDHPLALPRKAISFGDSLLGYVWKLSLKHAPKPELTTWRRP